MVKTKLTSLSRPVRRQSKIDHGCRSINLRFERRGFIGSKNLRPKSFVIQRLPDPEQYFVFKVSIVAYITSLADMERICNLPMVR